jgi:hypothetical protein
MRIDYNTLCWRLLKVGNMDTRDFPEGERPANWGQRFKDTFGRIVVLIKSGNIRPGNLLSQFSQQGLAVGTGFNAVDKPGKQAFGFPDQKAIDKMGDGFRVDETGDASGNDKWMGIVSLRGLQRNSGIL